MCPGVWITRTAWGPTDKSSPSVRGPSIFSAGISCSAGWQRTGAPVAAFTLSYSAQWSGCVCVSKIALTRRPPMAATTASLPAGMSTMIASREASSAMR